MYDTDYEDSWQAASGNVGIMKKILFLISAVIFLFIAGITTSILNKADVNIESCKMVEEKNVYYDYGNMVNTRIAAEKILFDVVGPVEFSGDSLELCGVAFEFIDENGNHYRFCQNGLLYRTVKECGPLL